MFKENKGLFYFALKPKLNVLFSDASIKQLMENSFPRHFGKLFCFILLASVNAKGQTGKIYPDNFLVYFNAMHLVNPSYIPAKENLNAGISYKTKSKISDISTFEVHLEKTFRKKEGPTHLLRAYAFNEQEGPYISYPKIFANYAYGVPLNRVTRLFAGLSAGLSRVSFSAPSGSGSATVFDAALGFGLSHKNISFGGACYQALNNEASVVSSPLVFHRFYHLHFEGRHHLATLLDAKGYFLYRHLPLLRPQFNAGGSLLYNDFFEAGGIYQLRRGVAFFGIFRFNPEVNPFAVSFAYNTAVFTSLGPSYEYYELSLSYVIK